MKLFMQYIHVYLSANEEKRGWKNTRILATVVNSESSGRPCDLGGEENGGEARSVLFGVLF